MFSTSEGEATKLKIQGFKKGGETTGDPFEAQFNPTTIEMSYHLNYYEENYSGAIGSEMKWNNTKPLELRFEITLDETIIHDGVKKKDGVKENIKSFKKNTIEYIGKAHQPPLYSKVSWGEFKEEEDFIGRLTELDITYSQFELSGVPLAAKLSVAFKQYMGFDKMLEKQKKSSPDLTHQITVLAGDTLPSMTQRIYGDARYYKQVARYNRLTNIRTLQPGTQINFPPLES